MIVPIRALCGTAAFLAVAVTSVAGVRVVARETEERVEVTIDGRPFTAYLYRPALKKPVLFPLRTDTGRLVTRGYPLEPRPGERVDHPHHTGLWFDYGDVQGVDFWNNSEANGKSADMGTIVHRAVRRAESGKRGILEVELEWRLPGAKPVLREETRYVFATGKHERIIDRLTTLTALDERVVLHDSKEGLIGMRVARFLEQPEEKAVALTDAAGRPGPAVADTKGVTGRYRTSEGKTGDDVWGTRGRWAALEGQEDGEIVTLAILDHPKNPGHPTYWHARGYGLFAANPLGASALDPKQAPFELTLARGESARFRYRVIIASERRTDAQIEKAYRRFIRDVD